MLRLLFILLVSLASPAFADPTWEALNDLRCVRCDLAGANFVLGQLEGVDLSGARRT